MSGGFAAACRWRSCARPPSGSLRRTCFRLATAGAGYLPPMAGDVLLLAGAVALAMMLGVWLLSLARGDASIVDSFWGLGFVLIAWVSFAVGDGWETRGLLV